MNHLGKIAICVAGGLVLTARLHADPAALAAGAGNPYSPIVDRNIFGLLPPPAPVDPNLAIEADLPKITANGIMDVFGNLKVLFKTSTKPGEKDNYYDLAEGQSEDDIEVVKIDEKAQIVIFRNHGTEEQVALVSQSSGGGGGGGNGGGGMPNRFGGNPGIRPGGGFNGGGFNNGGGAFHSYGGSNPSAQNGFNNNNGNNGGYNGGGPGGVNVNGQNLNFNGGGPQNRTFAAPQMDITPQQQVILMEANRAALKQQGDTMASIIPPTAITQDVNGDGSDGGGAQ